MNEIIQKNWLTEFLIELDSTQKVYIISPFISRNIVKQLFENFKGNEIKIITRFNLNDFYSGASCLSAIKDLVSRKAKVKGVRNLHSKVYMFDEKCTIITSANFTSGGFFNNYEFGIKSTEKGVIEKAHTYFSSLWNLESKILTLPEINNWQKTINKSKRPSVINHLPDYGFKASLQGILDKQYFIKFFGKTDYRETEKYLVKREIESSHCHWALTFSGKRGRYGNGRPRKYNDGDIVYMARMLEGGAYAIFGKGIALRHKDKRDIASLEDQKQVSWKKDWPIYIRVTETQFIDTNMGNCPKLGDLMNELDYDSFPSTQKRFLSGFESINPKDSLRQQADIRLTDIAAEWIENKFQEAIIKYGLVDQNFIDSLYQGTPTINEILTSE
jgi:hypothetical protein